MRRDIVRRLLQLIPVLGFVSVISSFVLHLSLGDSAVQMYGAQMKVENLVVRYDGRLEYRYTWIDA